MRRLHLMSLLLVLTAALPSAARDPDPANPGVDFTVATRPKKDGRTSEAIHQFALYCGLGARSLDILVLNECEPTGSPKAAYAPKLITWATWAGTLERPEPGAVKYVALEGTSLIPLACPLLATGVKK